MDNPNQVPHFTMYMSCLFCPYCLLDRDRSNPNLMGQELIDWIGLCTHLPHTCPFSLFNLTTLFFSLLYSLSPFFSTFLHSIFFHLFHFLPHSILDVSLLQPAIFPPILLNTLRLATSKSRQSSIIVGVHWI